MNYKKYKELFGCEYENMYYAPARINLIGEHIDYNGGIVLPAAISLYTYAYVSRRKDNKICLYSSAMDKYLEKDFTTLEYCKDNEWANYPLGVFKYFIDAGIVFTTGINIYYESNIPLGSGLSSSASILDLTTYLICEEYNVKMTLKQIAIIAQNVENNYCGLSCGIMDEAIIALGKHNQALFLDCTDFKYSYRPLNLDKYTFVVLKTNKTRLLTESKYNERVDECRRALQIIKDSSNEYAKINTLSDLNINDLNKICDILNDEVLFKRVKHVITENKRVNDFATLLSGDNYFELGNILNKSHQSLKEDYEVTGFHLDAIVDAAVESSYCLGARMTGAGFGGCAIALVEKEFFAEFKVEVEKKYFEKTAINCDIIRVDIVDGVSKGHNRNDYIASIINYAITKKLIEESDKIYFTNRLLSFFHVNNYQQGHVFESSIDQYLNYFVEYAVSMGIIDNTQGSKDEYDTEIMGIFIDRPSNVINEFNKLYQRNRQAATSYFYNLAINSNYIRNDRIAKDVRWKTSTKYGLLDLTINRSKPEKDPLDIAKAKLAVSNTYPKCALCKENEGYHGDVRIAARSNLRLIPLKLSGKTYYLQYSPYVYYNEHCIVLNEEHVQMKIDESTFQSLLEFVDYLPHYFIGSNADLPIVGGSILSHDHFQGGCYHFAMEDAEMRHRFIISPYLDVTCYILYWPLSVIRLQSKSKQQLIKLSAHILNTWIDYRDEELNIIPYTDGIRHHTITPIARKKGDLYEMDLVLRSNITNSEHPLGIFHPHEEHHHLKKENIGLIEVMGLAVLPGRLVSELRMIKEALKENIPFASQISYHEAWIKQIMERRMLTKSMFYEDFDNIIKEEIGYKFACILEDAGVFKTDQIGYEHFIKFTKNL